MHVVQVELSDKLYDQARRRATEAGFTTVDEFIADVVSDELSEETENFDHFFTPERLAIIDEAVAQVKAGQVYTMEEVREHLAAKRAEWIEKNSQ